ncbi:MAG TPA: hypothetical protein VKE92_06020 [Anaerolineales bacterium]|nr:hypothetical protein [Anaerolineales bacterium]
MTVYTVLLSFFLMSCASQPANAQSGDEPVFTATTKNQDDQINIEYENGVTTFEIHSPTGIGTAKFDLESGSMPQKLILRLHLEGLEGLRLVSSQATIAASASSSDAFNTTDQRVMASGNEYSLTPIDPLWMKIEIISGETDKKIPLENEYFEIMVPKEFIHSAGNSFEVQWIDFFR